jgi:arylsulfatase A-like enzyme
VLVLTDDLGWGELGCYGQSTIQTPHVDRLAAQGIRFTRFYSGAPRSRRPGRRCGPGCTPGTARVRNNPPGPGNDLAFEPEDTTIAQVLQAAGYRTGLFGKWGFCPEDGAHPSHPHAKGFLVAQTPRRRPAGQRSPTGPRTSR